MRRFSLAAGLLLLAVVWLGPLVTEWRQSLTAGMVAHMGVIAIAAPLIAIGLAERRRPRAQISAAVPIVASLFELLAVWGWHSPAMRAAAEASLVVTAAEQITFLAAGLFLWWTSFARAGRMHAAAGAVALLMTSIHMTLLGALLALSPRPLYGIADVTCFGTVLSAAQDQQLGGVIMLAVGAIIYLAGGVARVRHLLFETEASYSACNTR